jgi:hypothetical protein
MKTLIRNIIAHRGFWLEESEKNSLKAFERAFANGFGVETDLRDRDGEIVISHEPALAGCITLDRFFQLYIEFKCEGWLALNIKSDGLAHLLLEKLNRYQIVNYFVFDMSVPDMLSYIRLGIKTYTRRSDIEISPALYREALGVWFDEFGGNTQDDKLILSDLYEGKLVCLVSPELHGNSFQKAWGIWKQDTNLCEFVSNLQICTDRPQDWQSFGENND